MKKLLLLLIIPFLSFGQTPSDKEIEEYFTYYAAEWAEMLPMKVDKYTTIMNVIYSHKHKEWMFQTTFDLGAFLNDDLTEQEKNELTIKEWGKVWLMEQETMVGNQFCTDPAFKPFIDYDVLFSYHYTSLVGNYIGKIEFQKSSCK